MLYNSCNILVKGRVKMDFTEKTISTKRIFDGRIINLKVDTVTLPNGHESTRELVEHPGGVGVIAVDDEKNVFMVTQYRKPFDEIVLEIPAGKLNYGENPLDCGMRELEEETGITADNYEYIGVYYPTPGYCLEKITIYLATGLKETRQHLDEDEFLDVHKIKLDTLFDMVMNNEINDAKTAIAILKAKAILG